MSYSVAESLYVVSYSVAVSLYVVFYSVAVSLYVVSYSVAVSLYVVSYSVAVSLYVVSYYVAVSLYVVFYSVAVSLYVVSYSIAISLYVVFVQYHSYLCTKPTIMGVHTAHTTCKYIQLHISQSISCAGRDEAPKIVKSEEPVERGRKGPSLEELEVPESTPLAGIPPVPPSLPLSFDVGVGVRLVNAVRSLTGISHSQSISAAEATMRFVGTEVPALSDTMDALIVALAASR